MKDYLKRYAAGRPNDGIDFNEVFHHLGRICCLLSAKLLYILYKMSVGTEGFDRYFHLTSKDVPLLGKMAEGQGHNLGLEAGFK